MFKCLELSQENEFFASTESVKNREPYIDVVSFELLELTCVSAEVAIHVAPGEILRMKLCISGSEDEYVLVNVESDNPSNFDWVPFNIDPSKKNILVFRFNGSEEHDTDCHVEEYEMNSEFFNAFEEIFELEDSNYADMYDFLKKQFKFLPTRTYRTVFSFDETNETFPGFATKNELDIRHQIIGLPLSKITGLYTKFACLEKMMEILELTYFYKGSEKNDSEQEKDSIRICNVSGVSQVICFTRDNFHHIDTNFTLKFNNLCWRVSFVVKQQFYYGHDGYEGYHQFVLEDCETKERTHLGGYAYGTSDSVVWESDNVELLESIGLPFNSISDFIGQVIDKLLPQLPCYDPFYCKLSSSQSLSSYLKGNEE